MASVVSVGTARVSITSETDGFVRGINNATRSLNRNQREVANTQQRFRQFTTRLRDSVRGAVSFRRVMLGAAGAITAVGLAIRGFGSQSIDLLSISDQTNIVVEDVQRIQRVFQDFNIDAEATNDILREGSKRIIEFGQAGTGTAGEAFEMLGISIQKANGEFKNALDILNELGDRSDLTAQELTFFFDEIFAGRGEEVAGVFAQLRRDGLSFGQAMQQVSSNLIASEDQLRAVADANRFLSRTFQSISNSIRVSLAETLRELQPVIEQFTMQLSVLIPQAVRALQSGIQLIANNFNLIRNAFIALVALRVAAFFRSLGAAIGGAATATGVFSGALVVAKAALRGLFIATGIGAFIVAIELLITHFKEIVGFIESIGQSIKENIGTGGSTDSVMGFTNSLGGLQNQLREINTEIDKLNNVEGGRSLEQERAREALIRNRIELTQRIAQEEQRLRNIAGEFAGLDLQRLTHARQELATAIQIGEAESKRLTTVLQESRAREDQVNAQTKLVEIRETLTAAYEQERQLAAAIALQTREQPGLVVKIRQSQDQVNQSITKASEATDLWRNSLDQVRNDVEGSAIVFDQIALAAEQVRAALQGGVGGEFEQNLNNLSSIVQDINIQTDQYLNSIKEVRENYQDIIALAAEQQRLALQGGEVGGEFEQNLQDIYAIQQRITEEIERQIGQSNELKNNYDELVDLAAEKLRLDLQGGEVGGEFEQNLQNLYGIQQRITEEIERQIKGTGQLRDHYADIANAAEMVRQAQQGGVGGDFAGIGGLSEIDRQTTADVEREIARRNRIREQENRKLLQAERDLQRQRDAIAREQLRRDERNFRQHLQQLREQERAVRNVSDQFGNAFGNLAVSLTTDFDNARDVARRFVQDLQRILLDRVLFAPVQKFFSNLIGGLIGSTGGLGGGIFGAAADGGFHRGLTLVGERGPELVDLGSGSQVYSNERINQALNSPGGGITYNFNIQGSNREEVRRGIQEAIPFQTDLASARIQQDISRQSPIRSEIRRI